MAPAPNMPEDVSSAEGGEVSSDVNDNREDLSQGTATAFPKFGKLPLEIRTMIWKQASGPRRLVTPWYFPTSSPRPSDSLPLARVCREARAVALSEEGLQLVTAIRYVHSPETGFREGGTYQPFHCWYNKKTDLIYLDGGVHSCVALCLAPLDRSQGNEVANLAEKEPDAGLLVAASMGKKFDHGNHSKLYWILAAFTNYEIDEPGLALYGKFLKPREHCFLELWRIDIPLAGAARDEAIRTGMMSHRGVQTPPAIIDPDDTGALERYLRLMDLSTPHTGARTRFGSHVRAAVHELVSEGGFKVGTAAQKQVAWFVRKLVRSLCPEGLSLNDLQSITDADGNLSKQHPLVVRHDISPVPRFTPMVVFQLLDEETIVDSTVAEGGKGIDAMAGPVEDDFSMIYKLADAGYYHTWAALVRQLMRLAGMVAGVGDSSRSLIQRFMGLQ